VDRVLLRPGCRVRQVIEIDASQIKPTVSFPHLPSNTRLAEDSRDIWVDQVVIGSCTNGRIEDMRIAAEVLKGRTVHENVRLIIIPATQEIYRQAMHEGLFDIFLDANAAVSTPTCGPCLGGHMGILAAGERAVATTNRNFVGRMGDPTSEVYLSSPRSRPPRRSPATSRCRRTWTAARCSRMRRAGPTRPSTCSPR
jgi:3-isopropylmalate/(R)-2-methylmalate dehydratase large subunit